jgi:retinol dehydrogenase-12
MSLSFAQHTNHQQLTLRIPSNSNHVESLPLLQSVSVCRIFQHQAQLTTASPASFLTTFLRSQFTALPYPTHPFTNQTIIVTGANTGLGLEAARHFVRLGAAKVILGCRSLNKGFNAKKDIERSFQVDPAIIEVWEVDLSSYASVKAFCGKVAELDRVDAIVENAGVATPIFELVEGMEKTITVNVISTFLMALLVLPKLRESAMKYNMVPKLTIVASDAYEQVCFLYILCVEFKGV